MNTMLLVVIVLVVVAAVALFSIARYRRGNAREEFGPEYERLAQQRGSEKEAERVLRARREKVDSQIRPLSDYSRRHYKEEWERVERTFVDNPPLALEQADRVVTDILSERNFPTESRQEATDAVGVTHPKVVEDFRNAQHMRVSVTGSGEEGNVEEGLEQMRQAIQKYRSVYERLI